MDKLLSQAFVVKVCLSQILCTIYSKQYGQKPEDNIVGPTCQNINGHLYSNF